MRTFAHSLLQNLKRQHYSVYLVFGEEPLQHTESVDLIRRYANSQGFQQREVFYIDKRYDWNVFINSSRSLSLFSQKRLLELRFSSVSVDKAAAKVLLDYLNRPPPETMLLVDVGKMSKSSRNAAWFREMDKQGLIVQITAVPRQKLLPWLSARIQAKGMTMEKQALALLAANVEGNLLAAKQEIDKLFVLYGPSKIEVDAIQTLVTSSAHFDVYELVDSSLREEYYRIDRILDNLRAQGVAPAVILWALTREIRVLEKLEFETLQGAQMSQAFRNQNVWDNRKLLLEQALKRLSLKELHSLLSYAASVDRVIKGLYTGFVWEALRVLCFALAGLKIDDKPLMLNYAADR